MAPPIPPPPPMLSSNSANNTAPMPVLDNKALLSQIRQGTKLKKTAQVNDRSSPIVAGSKEKSAGKQSETKSITPSMFKNGTNPLNLNFKLPTPIGSTPSTISNNKRTVNQNSSNSNTSLKSNLSSANSSISSKASNSSFNSSASNIAKSLTLRSPSKSTISDNKSTVSIKSDTTVRPSIRPPPLPNKPPAINRRQSFDSGQLEKSLPSIKPSKPPPPPRTMTMKPAPPAPSSQQLTTQTPNRQNKSTQNLSMLSNTNHSSSSVSLNYSTMKLKTSTKNYPSSRPNLGAPPPPPIQSAPRTPPISSNNVSNTSPLSQFNVPKPPLPNFNQSTLPPAPLPPVSNSLQFGNLPNPPLPPSITSNMMNNTYNQPLNAAPMPPLRNNLSKDLESRFHNQFTDISLLPGPDPFTGFRKTYGAPNKSKLHRAPLPPNERQGPGFPIQNY